MSEAEKQAAEIVDAVYELVRTEKEAWVKNDGPTGYNERRDRTIALLATALRAQT